MSQTDSTSDEQKGDAEASLAAPVDPALASAIAAFERGDFAEARRLSPEQVADTADDRAHAARLERGLGWEPTLWIGAAAMAAIWVTAFILAH